MINWKPQHSFTKLYCLLFSLDYKKEIIVISFQQPGNMRCFLYDGIMALETLRRNENHWMTKRVCVSVEGMIYDRNKKG